ncbi:hypothetical protein LZ30DRAFT_560064, partial [Colletotrichum cereale]
RREYYAQNKGQIFDGLAEKRDQLVILDFGTVADSGSKGKLYLVRDVEGLRANEDVLLDILTYHQVPAHFLSF